MVILHSVVNSTSGDMEWSADGDNTDCSTTSSPTTTSSNRRNNQHHQDHGDSLSEEDDLSDEFSLVDSDEDKKSEAKYNNHQVLQVSD